MVIGSGLSAINLLSYYAMEALTSAVRRGSESIDDKRLDLLYPLAAWEELTFNEARTLSSLPVIEWLR